MYLEELIKILEVIKVKYGDIPLYLLNKEYDLFAEINRIYVENVEGEEVLILSENLPNVLAAIKLLLAIQKIYFI